MATQNLREALRIFLNDWRKDVPLPWQGVLAGVEPDFDAVKATLTVDETKPIFPGRKDSPLPGAAPGAHVFRALTGLSPDQVRAVVIGQDPYPNIARATGRSFDQGDLVGWTDSKPAVASSLKTIAQVAAHFRTGDEAYLTPNAGWTKIVADLKAHTLSLEAPPALFEHWEKQGVLFLNAALTISGYERGGSTDQEDGHLPLWRPIINKIIEHLANRPQGQVVFLTWGYFARKLLAASHVSKSPQWQMRAFATTKWHPSTPEFLKLPTTFSEANKLLMGAGGTAINW